MSSSFSGKFQDHYAILGVDPKADLGAIQAAYEKLTSKYKPNDPDDYEKLEAASLALEVLSDPALRGSFDKLKGLGHDDSAPRFSGPPFFEALKTGADLRVAILCVLYDRRRTTSLKPVLSNRHLEGMMQVSSEELTFALWYLKQRNLVINDDKSNLQISVDGMDYLERNPPSAENAMRFLKPDAVVAAPGPSAGQNPSEVPAGRESVLVALQNARRGKPSAESKAAAKTGS